MTLEERVTALEKKVSSLEAIIKKEKREERKKNSTPRPLTEYQKFISEEIIRLKKEEEGSNTQTTHKERFKKAVSLWTQRQQEQQKK